MLRQLGSCRVHLRDHVLHGQGEFLTRDMMPLATPARELDLLHERSPTLGECAGAYHQLAGEEQAVPSQVLFMEHMLWHQRR